MSGFSVDWLNLREGADRRARDRGILERAVQWLHIDHPAAAEQVVVDLGAGTGSTLRALSGHSANDAADRLWRLVDHDEALLSQARRRHGDGYRLQLCTADLADVAALPLNDARLVTASALFDLVSAEFIEALADILKARCQISPVGLYGALTYDGTILWTPAHPLDGHVRAALNRDQRRDKGFGPALGPEAGTHMKRAFSNAGFAVWQAPSPWVLDGNDGALVSEFVEGVGRALTPDPALETKALQEWVRFRLSKLPAGTLTVGHSDFLALPEQTGDQ